MKAVLRQLISITKAHEDIEGTEAVVKIYIVKVFVIQDELRRFEVQRLQLPPRV